MDEPIPPPWPIPLRRSALRLAFVVGLRGGVGIAALVTSLLTFGVVAMALLVAAAVCLVYAAALGAWFLTLRLEAWPGELRVRSLFGSRRYRLRKGEVRRLWVDRSSLSVEARVAGMGVRVGEGQLGGERLMDVIALDRTSTLVMVPVEGGRVVVAAASEEAHLAALLNATASSPPPADANPVSPT